MTLPTKQKAIATNGQHPPEKRPKPGKGKGADAPTAQPAATMFEILTTEIKPVAKEQLESWLLDNAEKAATMKLTEIERMIVVASGLGVSKTFLNRSWKPIVTNTARKGNNDTKVTNALSERVRAEFQAMGYSFSLNNCTSEIYVNDKPIDDGKAAEIRVQMRDRGYNSAAVFEDVYITDAFKKQFHPIKDYLESLTWNGQDHIHLLSKHLEDKHEMIQYGDYGRNVIRVWLHRWLVGAVSKIYVQKAQNPVLVLAGPQDLGKSNFAKWLCSPLPDLAIESPIEPDNPEHNRFLASKWIWEAGELGATTSKANYEALKAFLTKMEVTYRVPYAKHAITRPTVTSFIGTINPELTGFLIDPTGNRRYLTVDLTAIDWTYEKAIDIDQVWAQAYALHKAGESWRLTKEEMAVRDAINSKHERPDFTDDVIDRYFEVDQSRKDWQMTAHDIADRLRFHGITGEDRSLMTRIGIALGKRKLERDDNANPRVYKGIRYKDKVVHPTSPNV